MKPRVMAELVSQYVDRINAGRDDTEAYLSLFHSHRAELRPLFTIVKMLRTLLVKSEPSPAFVETLGTGLRLAAEQAIADRHRDERGWALPASRRSMVLGAAALGSIAWLAAMLLLSRSRTAQAIKTAA